MTMILFEGVGGTISSAKQFLLGQSRCRTQGGGHFAEMIANIIESLDGNRCKGCRRARQIHLSIPENRRNVFDPRENLSTSLGVKRTRDRQCFNHRRQCLLDVEGRISLPSWIDIQLPTDTR